MTRKVFASGVDIESSTFRNSMNQKLKQHDLPSRVLLAKARLIDPSSAKTSVFMDPNHYPFYYSLATKIPFRKMIEFGVGLGLATSCLIQGRQGNVETILGFQESSETHYPQKLAEKNIRDYVKRGTDVYIERTKLNDVRFLARVDHCKWDLVVFSEMRCPPDFLDFIWSKMESGGVVIMDHIHDRESVGELYDSFCKRKNREPVIFKSRFGIGLLQK